MEQNDPSKLGHLPQAGSLTEYLIPVLCTGVKYIRLSAASMADAVKRAEDKITKENRYSSNELYDFKARALAPELMLEPEDRAAWPYWGYGWYGIDGIDWRSHRTDKGPGAIPDIAEESWPMAPFVDD